MSKVWYKKALSFLLAIVTTVSGLALTGCDTWLKDLMNGFNNAPETSVKRENGESIAVETITQVAEKNENFLETEVSWYDDVYNYYVYNVGKIKNVPLTSTYAVFYYDGATLTYEREVVKATESSIEIGTSAAVTKSVTTGGEFATSLKVGAEAAASKSEGNGVKATVEKGYSMSITNSTTETNAWTTSRNECLSSSESESNTITITFDDSCKKGNYIYLFLGTINVYYTIIQSRENPDKLYLATFSSVVSHKYALCYAGENDEYPIDENKKIEVDSSFVKNLVTPTKYIEGFKEEVIYEPIVVSWDMAEKTVVKAYYGHTFWGTVSKMDEYIAQGYNKIKVEYSYYATAERGLLGAKDDITINGYVGPKDDKTAAVYSYSGNASINGTWITGEVESDLKWFKDTETVYLYLHNTASQISGRQLTISNLTLTVTLYKE